MSTLHLGVPTTELTEDAYSELAVAGETVMGSPADILTAVQTAVDACDPDILVCATSELVPTLHEMAAAAGHDEFTLSRWPAVDYQQLARRSTYASYCRSQV
jgi:DNA polymerase I